MFNQVVKWNKDIENMKNQSSNLLIQYFLQYKER